MDKKWVNWVNLWTFTTHLAVYTDVESLNISVYVAKCVENVHKFNKFTHFLSVTKNDFSWLNNLFMERFLLNRMSTSVKTNYRCVESLNISVDVAKCVENVHKLIHYIHFGLLQKMTCQLNNLFMAKFQLIRMSSYAKNKLQMCSVTQHQCRHRQMCGKCWQIHQVTHFLQKRLVLIEQSIHGKVST